MSSRTNIGQKRILSRNNTATTPSKTAWDIVGLSSVGSIIVTSMIFMIGWAYESNWYAYFGVSVAQLNIPIQQILIVSIKPIILFVWPIPIILLFYSVIPFLKKKNLQVNDWLNILVVSHIVSIIFLGITIFLARERISLESYLFLNEIIYVWLIFTSFVFVILLALFWVIIGALLLLEIFLVRLLIYTNKTLIQQRKDAFVYGSFNPITKDILLAPLRLLFSPTFKYLLIPLMFLSLLSASAALGVSNAASGKRGIGGNIQKIYYVSRNPITALHTSLVSCAENDECIYGPFGLIAENENSFFLIKWKENDKNAFLPNPGVYILPRSDPGGDAYFVVPEP